MQHTKGEPGSPFVSLQWANCRTRSAWTHTPISVSGDVNTTTASDGSCAMTRLAMERLVAATGITHAHPPVSAMTTMRATTVAITCPLWKIGRRSSGTESGWVDQAFRARPRPSLEPSSTMDTWLSLCSSPRSGERGDDHGVVLLTLDLVLPGEQSPQLPRGAAPLAEPLAFLHRAPPFVEPLGLPPFQPFARLARRFAGVEIPLVAKPPSRPNATAAGFFFLAMLITSIPGPMYYSAVGFSTGRDFPEFPQRCNLTHRS